MFFDRLKDRKNFERELEHLSPAAAYTAMTFAKLMAGEGFTIKKRMPIRYAHSQSFLAVLFALLDFIQANWNEDDEDRSKQFSEVLWFLFGDDAKLALSNFAVAFGTDGFHEIGRAVQDRLANYLSGGLPKIDDMQTELGFLLEYVDRR